MSTTQTFARPLHAIAGDALADRTLKGNARRFALPYLRALTSLASASDYYGGDRGDVIVAYALSNLAHWRGEKARAIKAELRAHIGA